MKNKASVFLKQIITLLSSIAKAKSLAIKSKTSAAKARLIMFSLVKNKKVLMDTVSHKIHSLLRHDHRDQEEEEEEGDQNKSKTSAAKARLIMFSLVKNKKVLMDTVSHKIHSLLGHDHRDQGEEEEGDQNKALVLYNAMANEYSHTAGTSSYMRRYKGEDEEEDDDDDKYPDLTHSLFDENENFDDVKAGGSVIDLVKNSKEEGQDFKLEDEIDHVADLFINRFHKQMRLQKLLSFKRHQEMLDRSV
ncbi:uncharacterized protein LOC126597466 isoform X1 [Malus sylvestris]|uniref:uncharacterized protein LOC126597466 isoform X1 n=1 Tax=Malus sylvestris TaxID=3752 RepID=UPI0021ABA269|nr:uncharacterized protein LOC126597466 isoform X1 [Malus sylvestris]